MIKQGAFLSPHDLADGQTALVVALAQSLLNDLGADFAIPVVADAAAQEAQAWMDSGLARISAMPSQELAVASTADALILALRCLQADKEMPVVGRRLLGMRLLSHDLAVTGTQSANRSCRLLKCRDGVLAVNLARDDDWDLLPAWLQTEGITSWQGLAAAMAQHTAEELVARARELGLPVALSQAAQMRPWFSVQRIAKRSKVSYRNFRILDLSALWAGPLCSNLLQSLGAQVVRLENPQRPDGARMGPSAFFNALNDKKQSLALDLTCANGKRQFHRLLADADLVIESSRPRALQQLDLWAEDLLQQYPGLNWLSITGYGREPPEGHWVAFGDDAAVAGGLAEAAAINGQAQFCGDAIADPLSGMHAALLATAAAQAGGGYLLSVPMRDVVSNVIHRSRAVCG